jgi:GntR family histidine utilization transcriptional repressor
MSTAIPARGEAYDYECLGQRVVGAAGTIGERLGMPEGSPVRHVLCRHRADGEVIELEERWINLNLLPEAEVQDFTEVGPAGWLLEATPWTEAEHTVRAVNAGPRLSELLETGEGAACLVLERRTFQGDRVVTWARLTHPGDRHRMTERFSPAC